MSGSICNASGLAKYTVNGHWDTGLKIKNKETGEEIQGYSINSPLPGFELSYFFTEFAMQLNLPPELVQNIAPTDSRFRPDQRALENAQLDLAATEKNRLEDKQRRAKKLRDEIGEEYSPKWFVHLDAEDEWVYKGGYWEAKKSNDFAGTPNLY